MKNYTKEQLQGIAADVFSRYPKAQTVACTEDGQAFVTDDTEHYLKEHARTGRYSGGMKAERFRRCDMPAAEASTLQAAAKPAGKKGTGGKKEAKEKKVAKAAKETKAAKPEEIAGINDNGKDNLKNE